MSETFHTRAIHLIFIHLYLERNIRTRFRCGATSLVGDGRKNIHQLHHVSYYFVIWKREGSAN